MGFLDRLKKKPKKEEKMSDEDLAKMVEENTMSTYNTSHMDLEKGIPATYTGTITALPADIDPVRVLKELGVDMTTNTSVKSEESIEDYRKHRPETIAELHKMGEMCSLSKDYEAALKCFDKALELDPNNQTSWLHKGDLSVYSENYEAALKCFDKALELEPDDYVPWLGYAQVYGRQGRTEEAIKCINHVIEDIERDGITEEDAAPDRSKPWRKFLYNDLIVAYKIKGELVGTFGGDQEEAIFCFEKILELDPNGVSGINAKNMIKKINENDLQKM